MWARGTGPARNVCGGGGGGGGGGADGERRILPYVLCGGCDDAAYDEDGWFTFGPDPHADGPALAAAAARAADAAAAADAADAAVAEAAAASRAATPPADARPAGGAPLRGAAAAAAKAFAAAAAVEAAARANAGKVRRPYGRQAAALHPAGRAQHCIRPARCCTESGR